MKNRHQWFARFLILASLPLVAENLSVEGEEIALELPEIVQLGNRETAFFAAKNDDSSCSRKNLRETKESKKEPLAVVPEEQVIEMQRGVITPSVYPYINCNGMNSFASASFIWWKPVVGGTGYAYNGSADGYNVPFGDSVRPGTLKRPAFGFEPGFKVGLGTHFHHDGWDICTEYTYLAGSEEENQIGASEGKGGKTLINITTGDGIPATISFDRAKSEWKQNFSVVDLELGRNFFISKYLTMRPNAGLKTAWIHETLEYSFLPTPNTTDPRGGVPGADTVEQAFSHRQQHMWGLGIRGGIDTMWHVTKNWAFYGDLAFTTLWADFHLKAWDNLVESSAGEFQPLHVRHSVQTVIPVIEASLGLAYITWACDNSYRFQFQAGWEQQIWTDFNYFQQQGSGSLSTQGLTVKAGVTF
jgi:hypothetical protein